MRIIPIHGPDHVDSSCDEGSGEVPKLNLPLTRREWLKGSGILMGTLASGSALAALAPSPRWALELKKLTAEQGQNLMAMGRVLYPHKKLPDAVYALLVKDLDAKAAASADTAEMLREGVASLEALCNGNFLKAKASLKMQAVQALEGGKFFDTVRGQCVTSLYDNDMAFRALGYPGSAWEKGGYITRGFQDLKWLPEPSEEASPEPYFG